MRKRSTRRLSVLLLALAAPCAATAETLLVSAPEDPLLLGTIGSDLSRYCKLDADGSFAVFESSAMQLVPGDRNGVSDAFARNLQTGALVRLSVLAGGDESPGPGRSPAVSGSGRYVAFESDIDPATGTDVGQPQAWRLDRQTGDFLLASRRPDGAPGNEGVTDISISPNGRFVVFYSSADDLVAGDGNGFSDIFVFDAQALAVQRASTDAAGMESDAASYQSGISADGRYVGFESDAANLVAGDSNGARDVFVKDLDTGAIERVSVGAGGVQGTGGADFLAISADGDKVLFSSSAANLVAGDSNGATDIFIRARTAAATFRINVDSAGNQSTGVADAAMSADAGTVVFASTDDALDGPTGGVRQLFAKDTGTGAVSKLTDLTVSSLLQPTLSADGSTACFGSTDGTLAGGDPNGVQDVFAVSVATAQMVRVSESPAPVPMTSGNDRSTEPDISGDGQKVAFASEAILDSETYATHGVPSQRQVYVRDMASGAVTLASAAADGTPADGFNELPRISASGRYVAWQGDASELSPDDDNLLTDVYRKDLDTGEVLLVSFNDIFKAAGGFDASISADGSRIAFVSDAPLVVEDSNGGEDVYLWDAVDGIALLSATAAGQPGNGESFDPEVSADGRFVSFVSSATDLAPGSSGNREVFVRDIEGETTIRVSAPVGGAPDDDVSAVPSISADGSRVAFISEASNLVAGDVNGEPDVFIADLAAATLIRVPTERLADGYTRPSPDAPAFSGDGSHLTYWLMDSDDGGKARLLRYNLARDHLELLLERDAAQPSEAFPLAARSSDDGTLIAFAVPDPLLPEDHNGPAVFDVYRRFAIERTEGVFNDGFE